MHISDKSKKNIVSAYHKKQKRLDSIYSHKKLGAFCEHGKTIFRIFAPSAYDVHLHTFEKVDDIHATEYLMKQDENHVWEVVVEGELYGLFYGFIIKNHNEPESGKHLCIDPYAKAVATYNTYFNPRKSILIKNDYDWEGDSFIENDWRDLIIYELHVRDTTEHPSSGVKFRGTYKGLIEKKCRGGFDYIKKLGVNAVELLPVQEFANIEIPFGKKYNGRLNTWNPYERNHWGYMTAAFFAPDSYYSENVRELEWNSWSGGNAEAVTDLKDVVKAFHKEGITVIMDVVYNHLSEYELGNLKEIDSDYYFRKDLDGKYIAESFCGNDLKTERPMLRRLIVESILYWMKEYHIDGFRFDLGKLLDWETIESVISEAKKINPSVIFVCEPWGGGYDPSGFSVRGWGSWNDQIRNGIKGENPVVGHGWIFGKWYAHTNPQRIKSYVNGTLVRDKHGLFQLPEHSVNYLECHDGFTIGDFIRIGTGEILPEQKIYDRDEVHKLSPLQLKLNKLAALFLLTARGITMIHSGQEFARSKIIRFNGDILDPEEGRLDHNSYNKDNETNYINYDHAIINKELLDYYTGLIAMRKKYSGFRHAAYEDVQFFPSSSNLFSIGFIIKFDNEEVAVCMNASPEIEEEFILPEGEWDLITDAERAGIEIIGTVSGTIKVSSSTGMVLVKKK